METMNRRVSAKSKLVTVDITGLPAMGVALLPTCGKDRAKSQAQEAITAGVISITRRSLQGQITLSSELVPFQEISVYTKESSYVTDLLVDEGTRVKQGQEVATLEILMAAARVSELECRVLAVADAAIVPCNSHLKRCIRPCKRISLARDHRRRGPRVRCRMECTHVR